MKWESVAEKQAGIHESQEELEHHLGELKELLKIEAGVVKNLGFDVDDDLRINPNSFGSLLGEGELKEDKRKMVDLEKRFPPMSPEAKSRGEALEIIKTLLFSKELFGKQLVALRTCKYDDYINDVDELVLDRLTGEPMAVIDTTTDVVKKTRDPKVFQKFQNGCQIKYGFGIGAGKTIGQPDAIEKRRYDHLPLFIVSLLPDRLGVLAKKLATGSFEQSDRQELEKDLLTSLSKQAGAAIGFTTQDMKDSYAKAKTIFDSLGQKSARLAA